MHFLLRQKFEIHFWLGHYFENLIATIIPLHCQWKYFVFLCWRNCWCFYCADYMRAVLKSTQKNFWLSTYSLEYDAHRLKIQGKGVELYSKQNLSMGTMILLINLRRVHPFCILLNFKQLFVQISVWVLLTPPPITFSPLCVQLWFWRRVWKWKTISITITTTHFSDSKR